MASIKISGLPEQNTIADDDYLVFGKDNAKKIAFDKLLLAGKFGGEFYSEFNVDELRTTGKTFYVALIPGVTLGTLPTEYFPNGAYGFFEVVQGQAEYAKVLQRFTEYHGKVTIQRSYIDGSWGEWVIPNQEIKYKDVTVTTNTDGTIPSALCSTSVKVINAVLLSPTDYYAQLYPGWSGAYFGAIVRKILDNTPLASASVTIRYYYLE